MGTNCETEDSKKSALSLFFPATLELYLIPIELRLFAVK
jgi:hypothetical protein